MATSTSYREEECLNVYWKIKNFSYIFDGETSSAGFNLSGNRYWLHVNAGFANIECFLGGLVDDLINLQRHISFLTTDGSPEESISGGPGTKLSVPKDVLLGKRRNAFLPKDTLSVRFRFHTNTDRGNIFIPSKVRVIFKYFLWTLKDFCKNESTFEKSVENSNRYGDIKLNLKQKGVYNTDKQFYVEVTRSGGERCFYTLEMSILDSEGRILNNISDEHVFENKDGLQVNGFPLFFKRKKCLICENLVLSEDTLSLKCKFAISLGKLEDQTVYSYCESVTPLAKDLETLSDAFKGKTDPLFATELQSDLMTILDSGTLGDVSLKIDAEVLKVHKVILSARSPVFKAMFTKDMQETINNTVVIEDLDLETVRGLVLYMYTDTISDCHCEKIRKLYFAADKYEVLSLKNKCMSWLKTNLSISNVCEVLILADLHHDETLKRATFEFILKFDTQIFTLDTWKELKESHSKLALEVMCEIWSKKHMLN